MKNLFKLGFAVTTAIILTSGCSGCGDGDKGGHGKIDTNQTVQDSPKNKIDTTKAAIDTMKKDTATKK